jgi:L-ascorbate metabolism protein UlaG (beta-lactamase superfamily)
MGPELATRAAEMIKPKVAVPMHYATFPLLLPDASGFAPKGVEVKALQPGESLQYG